MRDRGNQGRRVLVGGGIGAGKSTVLRALEEAGYQVIEADRVGHRLLAEAGPVKDAVIERWPEVADGGIVSRPALAAIVFTDPGELQALEAITHPGIRADIERQSAAAGSASVAVEVPIIGMFDDGWYRIAVVAPSEERVQRAVARGGIESDVRARVGTQADDDLWRGWADAVIENTGSLSDLRDQVRALARELSL